MEKILSLTISDSENIIVVKEKGFFDVYENNEIKHIYPINTEGLDNLLGFLREELLHILSDND